MQVQDDAEGGRNSGFMYLRAEEPVAAFLNRALSLGRSKRSMRQQPAVNAVLREMLAAGSLTVQVRRNATLLLPCVIAPCMV